MSQIKAYANNHEMVEGLKANGSISTSAIENAFLAVDRAEFVRPEFREASYYDYPIDIGHSQTISQPTVVAFMLRLLELELGQSVLDVGSGSGWATSLIANLVGSTGNVIGVERLPDLVDYGQQNLARQNYDHAKIIPAGSELGYPDGAPYDRILVSAEALEVPWTLIKQMKRLGKMVIPIAGDLCILEPTEKGATLQKTYPVKFVPLIEGPSA